jgi:hypothetical protein
VSASKTLNMNLGISMTAVRSALTIAALIAGAAGCMSIDYKPQTAWEAQLFPEEGLEDPSASVAAVTRRTTTIQAGITLKGEPNTAYGWEIGRGLCGSALATRIGVLGSYPNLNTDEGGDAVVQQTFITGTLTQGQTYYAAVVDADDRTVVLACAPLEEFSAGGNSPITG